MNKPSFNPTSDWHKYREAVGRLSGGQEQLNYIGIYAFRKQVLMQFTNWPVMLPEAVEEWVSNSMQTPYKLQDSHIEITPAD